METLADKITKADKALTESQNAYQTLTDAVQEYSEKGAISLSTWQDLMDLAPEYQALLSKQGDQLVIDTAAYNELTAAQRLEIETLVTQNGVTANTIQLLDCKSFYLLIWTDPPISPLPSYYFDPQAIQTVHTPGTILYLLVCF